MAVPKDLLEILVCSLCKSDLKLDGDRLHCTNGECRLVFSIQDDIPNMLIDEAERPCPKCSAAREWNEDVLRCPKCGATLECRRP